MRQIRSHVPAPRRYLDRRVVGTPEQVRRTIQRLQSSGRLIHASPWHETREGVEVTVRFLEHQQVVPAPRRRRWPVVAGVVSGGVAVLGVAAYALVQLVNAVIAALPYIGGGLLLLALVALLTRSRSSRTFSGTFTGRMH